MRVHQLLHSAEFASFFFEFQTSKRLELYSNKKLLKLLPIEARENSGVATGQELSACSVSAWRF